MNRFELKCYMCNQTIGYMSLPSHINITGDYILRSTEDLFNNEKEAICCPICENRRKKVEEMTDEQQ